MDFLYKKIQQEFGRRSIKNRKIPNYIINNLNDKFQLRKYQKEAIQMFSCYIEKDFPFKNDYIHLLYHMATGSGKTLIMAANILYLYKRGYRNFLFFVDSTSTIDKTRENFLNSQSNKYLFPDQINFDGKRVGIREVDNFFAADEDNINIKFITIQGLHMHLNEPRENSLTYEDFQDQKTVLISDEAHHINALTKSESKLNKTEEEELNTWEGTVNKIFKTNKDNILLEYTATAELNNEKVREKYENKVLYQYSLKEFRKDKFSKEVEVNQIDSSSMERALQAIIVSQYRRKVAEKHKISLKPVVMMKANRVTEPDNYSIEGTDKVVSKIFKKRFHKKIKNLQVEDLREIKNKASGGIVEESFDFFENNNISLENLKRELQSDFTEERSISVDSKSESEEKQVLVNSLEDKDNKIRIVFAVNKLNEGWDVLNLFDIVRLYDTRDARQNKPGKTTVSEAQLIGRGARYYPFKVEEDQNKFKRKYDDDTENELRVLEELYYHCAHRPKYVSELKIALREEGILPEKSSKKRKMKVKENLKETDFWKKGKIFLNEKIEFSRSDVFGLEDLEIDKNKPVRIKLSRTKNEELIIFEEEPEEKIRETVSRNINSEELGKHVIRKALFKNLFYKFDNLENKYFPNLKSMEEFIKNSDYLKGLKIELTGEEGSLDLSQEDKLKIAQEVLTILKKRIKNNVTEYSGTKEFKPVNIKKKFENENKVEFTMKFHIEGGDRERGRAMSETKNEELNLKLSNKDWYIYEENYGTDQEKYFIRFINDIMKDLKEKFQNVYLLRNEGLFKIYRFSDGQAFEPDFVLFLQEENEKILGYQLFIEPKGEPFINKDQWKEDFLQEIEEESEIKVKFENKDFKLIGLPFYNEQRTKNDFTEAFQEALNLKSQNN